MTQGQFVSGVWIQRCAPRPTKVKEPSLPYYLPIGRERIVGCISFPKGISTMWNANSLIQDLELGLSYPFLTTITSDKLISNILWTTTYGHTRVSWYGQVVRENQSNPFCWYILMMVLMKSVKLTVLTNITYVIYWPSTELSTKRCICVNKRKNSGSRWALDNYITRYPDGSS